MVRIKNVQNMVADKISRQPLPSKQQAAPVAVKGVKPIMPPKQQGSKSPIVNPAGKTLPTQAVARGIARRSPPKVAAGIAKKKGTIRPKK